MMTLLRNFTLYSILFSRVQHIILDFRRENEDSLDDLKTQFNLLDNGYSVDLGKISNSLLQGTLSVIFSLLNLPSTNRGYFWNEEDFKMATFYNQASISIGGRVTNSNITEGEIVNGLTLTKTAASSTYSAGGGITYIATIQFICLLV